MASGYRCRAGGVNAGFRRFDEYDAPAIGFMANTLAP